MPQVDPVKSKKSPKRLGMVVVVVLVVAVGAGVIAGLVWWMALPSATKVAADVDALNDKGRYHAAMAELQAAQGRMTSTNDKSLILSRLAATSQDLKDYPNAIMYYQQLDKLQPHQFQTLMQIGTLGELTGQKSLAKDAYEQALAIRKTQATHTYAQNEIDDLTAKVAELSK